MELSTHAVLNRTVYGPCTTELTYEQLDRFGWQFETDFTYRIVLSNIINTAWSIPPCPVGFAPEIQSFHPSSLEDDC